MSRPEDIPESVWLEAGMLFDRLYDAEPNLEGGCYQGVTDTIARAIMAERERCAAIAEQAQIDLPLAPGLADGASIAQRAIVSAIRGES